MAVSLEVRPPLLDHILVQKIFGIPANIRVPDGPQKQLLKQSMSHLLPQPILQRPKKGFSAPWTRWMEKEREWAVSKLRSGGDRYLVEAELNGRIPLWGNGARIWALLLLQQWSLR